MNPPVLTELERIDHAIPGKQVTQLWLGAAVDPALVDFQAMNSRLLREKVAKYVRGLQRMDDSVQRNLCIEADDSEDPRRWAGPPRTPAPGPVG